MPHDDNRHGCHPLNNVQPTPHIYVTLVWASYTTRISATAGFPTFVSLPFQYNSVLQAYLPLAYEIQIPFTTVSTTPHPLTPFTFCLFDAPLAAILLLQLNGKYKMKHTVKKGTIYLSYTVFKNPFIGQLCSPYCKYVQYNV